MLKNKKNILMIALALVLIIVIIILAAVWWSRSNKKDAYRTDNPEVSEYVPEFMSDEEKAQFFLPPETKVQTLKRSADGQVEVYKIINSEEDVIYDPAAIGPISPAPTSENPETPRL